jgi:hypothetical protein
METVVVIRKSSKADKKYEAVIDGRKTVPFGAKGYSDFTLHKDPERKQRYIQRHQNNEDWSKTGINTPGFYAKHVLWNKDTIQKSVTDLNKKYKDVKFVLKNKRLKQ